MNYWLMKSEPGAYSIQDLQKDKVTPWDGVRNYQARNMMRDEMNVGDKVLFYHSNACDETGIVGEMEVASEAKVDVTQFDAKDSHYDPKAEKANPRWWCPDMSFLSILPRVVTLAEIKSLKDFSDSKLTQKGNRLSIIPLTKKQYQKVIQVSKR